MNYKFFSHISRWINFKLCTSKFISLIGKVFVYYFTLTLRSSHSSLVHLVISDIGIIIENWWNCVRKYDDCIVRTGFRFVYLSWSLSGLRDSTTVCGSSTKRISGVYSRSVSGNGVILNNFSFFYANHLAFCSRCNWCIVEALIMLSVNRLTLRIFKLMYLWNQLWFL